MTIRPCAATTRTGAPCKGYAGPGSRYCTFHDPALADTVAAARQRGASTTKNARLLKVLKIAGENREPFTAGEWRRVLSSAAVALLEGTVTPGQVNALANAARASVTVEEVAELETAIAELRDVAGLSA